MASPAEKEDTELSSHLSSNELSEDAIDQQESSLFFPSNNESISTPRAYRLRPIVVLSAVVSGFILILALLSPSYSDRIGSVLRLDDTQSSSPVTPSACSPCSGDALQFCRSWGEKAIRRSVSYHGTGAHTARLLEKIESGAHVKLGFLGGSITAGVDNIKSDTYPHVLATLLSSIYTKKFGTSFEVFNGALNGMGSSYFAPCWRLQLPQEVDAVFIEFSVNDPGGRIRDDSMDALLREFMDLPNKPAIFLIDMYSPHSGSWLSAGPGISMLGRYYDIPVISHKQVTYQHRHILNDTESLWAVRPQFPVGHHPNKRGHKLVADLLAAFIVQENCYAQTAPIAADGAEDFTLLLPDSTPWHPWNWYRGGVNSNMDGEAVAAQGNTGSEILCQVAKPGERQFHLNSLSVGFSPGQWKNKHFVVGSKPGDLAVFEVGRQGKPFKGIGLFYWKSATIGLGKVKCWFDDDKENGTELNGHWEQTTNIPVSANILYKGSNSSALLYCQILPETDDPQGRHDFRITAIVMTPLYG